MFDWILTNEPALRFGCFAAMVAVMMTLEAIWPKRVRRETRARRWVINASIIALDTVIVRFLVPLLPVGAALWAASQGVGLFNLVTAPEPVAVAGAILMLDLIIYLQHMMFHHVPILWRLHRMHHTDLDLDVSSGGRFHPVEIVLSIAIKIAAVVLLGAPAAAVVLFEIVLNATSLFNHANLRLPGWLDRVLRLILVTPDMHRVHHSARMEETNSNFGFNVTWWDRMFGTYRAQPADGHNGMTLGLRGYQDPVELGIGKLLVQPFRESRARPGCITDGLGGES